jgi:hypothetical protein
MMGKAWWMIAPLALGACSGGAKPEAPHLALQPIDYFDITQNKLHGASCSFVPAGGGLGAVFLAMESRALFKVDGHIVAIPVANGSAALPQGAHTHYAGPLYAARLTVVPGGGHPTLGVAAFAGHLAITDAKGQTAYDADGDAQCKSL